VAAKFQITLEQSRLFARLSGDFNPLHVDPLAARRLMFGSTVVHGVDILLRVIEAALRDSGTSSLTALKASFGAPLVTGAVAIIEVGDKAGQAAGTCGYRVMSDGRVIQQVILSTVRDADWPAIPPIAPFAPAMPQDRDFATLSTAVGTVPLGFDPAIAQSLYPALSRNLPPLQLAALLATTRIVGMECPGLHSVYTELDVVFDAARANDRTCFAFRVAKADPRFKLLSIAIDGGGASGKISTLVRPAPVAQPSFAEVCARVPQSAKQGCRAIVIGGSRGLGETAAKILAAAGADVFVTYAAGAGDAARVVSDIRNGGGRCGAFHLDVTSPPLERPAGLPADWVPTNIYYFASPHIDIRRGEAWNAALFARFCDFYVGGLARSIEAIDAWFHMTQPLKLFYPSSIFLDQPVRGAAEYAAAKAAGEQLCRDLVAMRRGLTAESPRLPRMLTDQTVGVKASQMQAPLDIMPGILISEGGQ
jgi:NADP-dependent 3-hydroxy acid dehydrogenase YdfG